MVCLRCLCCCAAFVAFPKRKKLEREKDKELRGVAAEALKELEDTFSVGLALVADHRDHSGIKPQADRGEGSGNDVPGKAPFAEEGGSTPWWAVLLPKNVSVTSISKKMVPTFGTHVGATPSMRSTGEEVYEGRSLAPVLPVKTR